MSVIKTLLAESAKTMNKLYGINPTNPVGFRQILPDKAKFKTYVRCLSEGMTEDGASDFALLANNTRTKLMENSMFSINAYESLHLPILRVFYPRLISKELFNIMPIDKPEIVQGFVKGYFENVDGTTTDQADFYKYPFPSVNKDISRVQIGTASQAYDFGSEIKLLDQAIGSGTTTYAQRGYHVSRKFNIIAVNNATPLSAQVGIDVFPDIDGNFGAKIPSVAQVTAGTTVADQKTWEDRIVGHLDNEFGILYVTTQGGDWTTFNAMVYADLEENFYNPMLRFEIDKVRFESEDRQISANWTIQAEQDAKALYDLSLQAEVVNMLGEQVALDIDRELVKMALDANATMNPASHTASFDVNPLITFTWGQKLWFENVIPVLNKLSAVVYADCLMGGANTIAMNPIDASILESLNGFSYVGDSVAGGEVGYRSATVQGGKWKILTSTVVPQGEAICKYRSDDLSRASIVLAPYVPLLLIPYPLGPVPSCTVMSRYATKVIRPSALACLKIENNG